ncbi:putative ABC transporter membrane subunit YhdX [Azospirillaceae bacterium]
MSNLLDGTRKNHFPAHISTLGAWRGNLWLRSVVFQLLALGGVIGIGVWLVNNALDNLTRQHIAAGFGFLAREASFAIGESMIPYTPADSYGQAVVVGLLNTIKVSLFGVVLSTILGVAIGIARLSRNWLVAQFAGVYVESVRNIPILLQLFLWYAVITEGLPSSRQAFNLMPGVYLSNRGLMIPTPVPHPAWAAAWIALGGALIGVFALRVWARKRQARTGRYFPLGWTAACMILGLPLLAYVAFGAPTALEIPTLRGFNFVGGATLSPELSALLLGLVVYTAGFIAEIVRSGILSVSHGQTEAGLALGLSPKQVTRLIILPQALRVIIPPVTSEYLKLSKNSALAVAIGYPDVVSVLNTIINQTGQAIEGVAMIMAAFFTVSIGIAVFMDWYNRHVALIER